MRSLSKAVPFKTIQKGQHAWAYRLLNLAFNTFQKHTMDIQSSAAGTELDKGSTLNESYSFYYMNNPLFPSRFFQAKER